MLRPEDMTSAGFIGPLYEIVDAVGSMGISTWLLLVFGIIAGLVVGVLPGLNFVMGVLLLLPFTYTMETVDAVVLMLTVYLAGTYGGALTAILLNIPGEPKDVPLLWDGHSMMKQGRAAQALGWAALAALAGGLVGWAALAFAAQPFASIALKFSSAEYFAVVLLGLTSVLALSGSSVSAALISLFAGMLVGTVGVDTIYGSVRYDFGLDTLQGGIDFIVVLIGVFALTEALTRFAQRFGGAVAQQPATVRTIVPNLRAIRERLGSFARGMAVGAFIGSGPGAGSTVSSFIAYGIEKKVGKHKHEVGNASPSGIIAPQSASTASVGGALIHLLVLGIPGSAASAVILGVFLLQDVQPGPLIFQKQPELVAAISAALLIGTVLMCVIGIVAAKPMIRMLSVSEVYVMGFVVLFAYIGAISLRQSMADVWIMTAFGVLGFFMVRGGYPLAPLVLGVILGPLAERYFNTAMIRAANDWTVFFTRPISAVLMAICGATIAFTVRKAVRDLRAGRMKDVVPADES